MKVLEEAVSVAKVLLFAQNPKVKKNTTRSTLNILSSEIYFSPELKKDKI